MSSIGSVESEVVPKTNKRITAYIENGCHVCEKYFSNASSLIKHMRNFHSIDLTPRKTGKNRPQSPKYEFRTKKQPFRRTLLGCPSCWFYCPLDFKRIGEHIRDFHLDIENEDTEDPIDENEADYDDQVYYDESPLDSNAAKADIFAAMDALTSKFKTLFK